MKCQFCNQRCRLLKAGEPDYELSYMTWLCEKHSARVLHHIQIRKYKLQYSTSIYGESREWVYTTVTWTNKKKQILSAYWWRTNNQTNFSVCRLIEDKNNWPDYIPNVIFKLDAHPKDFTPENIAQKVSHLTIFS